MTFEWVTVVVGETRDLTHIVSVGLWREKGPERRAQYRRPHCREEHSEETDQWVLPRVESLFVSGRVDFVSQGHRVECESPELSPGRSWPEKDDQGLWETLRHSRHLREGP